MAAGCATAPRLWFSWALSGPHIVAYGANMGLLKLQPLARLYARLLYKCNESITSDINRASGYRHHAALSPERRDPEGESRRDLAVGERSVTHGMNRKEIMRLKDANCRLNN